MRHPPWRPEANPPFPCGLGLKSTVGTAVSVPPLGQGGQGRREEDEEEEETRELLISVLLIRDILNKKCCHYFSYFHKHASRATRGTQR